jgi:A/G-specific adenine glycosylase
MTRCQPIPSLRPEPDPIQLVKPLLDWFRAEARDLPWRRTLDPYAVWVSETMLQQTQVKTVIPYWERWMQALPTVASLAATPEPSILKLWEGLGYYSRARNLKKAAGEIELRHGGRFPENLEAVLALPGIGRYTAGAITSIAFNQPNPILDGNVSRVLSRVFTIADDPKASATIRRLWALAESLVSAAALLPAVRPASPRQSAGPCSDLNQALMELGATTCTPRNPVCARCPILDQCLASRSGQPESFPRNTSRPPATRRRFIAAVVERNGMVLVHQRKGRTVNAGLWEFPNIEVDLTAPVTSATFPPYRIESPFAVVKHSITRYRIQLEAHLASIPARSAYSAEHEWVSLERLLSLPFSSAHAKLRSRLLARHQP